MNIIIPCISIRHLSHVSRNNMILLARRGGFIQAPHDNGFFLTIPDLDNIRRLPLDLKGIFERLQPDATYGWILLDVDGDVIDLPVY